MKIDEVILSLHSQVQSAIASANDNNVVARLIDDSSAEQHRHQATQSMLNALIATNTAMLTELTFIRKALLPDD